MDTKITQEEQILRIESLQNEVDISNAEYNRQKTKHEEVKNKINAMQRYIAMQTSLVVMSAFYGAMR